MLERFAMIKITKESSVSIDDALHLYQAVGWTNYTNQLSDVGAGLVSFASDLSFP